MSAHPQRWVKVNAQVDVKLSEIVTIVNSIEGLETLQSCQGSSGQTAYVYFSFGEWQNLCGFIFDKMAPSLRSYLGDDIRLEVIAADNAPFAKMSFSAEAIPQVTSALKEAVKVY
jgi:hypothetical protein